MLRADLRDLVSSVLLALLTGVAASFLLALLVVFATGRARAAQLPEPRAGVELRLNDAAGMRIGNAPLLDTRVELRVAGLLARAVVRQRFRNPADTWAEGVYVFPLPGDSAVDHLRLRYAGRVIEGEIQAREQARRTYRKARDSGRKAALLEQQRPNIFTTSVANIPPGGEILVEIEYQQGLALRDGRIDLRLPLVVGPRYIPGKPLAGTTAGFDGHGWARATDQVPDAPGITPPVALAGDARRNPVSLSVRLAPGFPLAGLESLHHPVEVERGADDSYVVRLRDAAVPADRDFVLRWRPGDAGRVSAALFRERHADHDYALLMLTPPTGDAGGKAVGRELILVVDTSGSMHGESIKQARAALQAALGHLRPGDRFNLIQFNSRTSALFEQAVPVEPATLRRALAYVRGLRADGGTEMLPAMRRALHDPRPSGLLRQVVFMTDGAVGNERALFEVIHAMRGASRLFTVGIGSAPNGHFMRRAARHGRGSFLYVGSGAEVAGQMQTLFDKLAAPVVTDIALHLPDGGEVQQAPDPVSDLYRGEPLLVVLRADRLPDRLRVTGRLGGRPWEHTLVLRGGEVGAGIHVLWARRSVADWLARGVMGESPAQVRQAVLRLGTEHHIVTPHTSLVAVDKTPSRPAGADLQSGAVPALLPHGWSARHVVGSLPQTATPALLYMLIGLACMAGGGLWRCAVGRGGRA